MLLEKIKNNKIEMIYITVIYGQKLQLEFSLRIIKTFQTNKYV